MYNVSTLGILAPNEEQGEVYQKDDNVVAPSPPTSQVWDTGVWLEEVFGPIFVELLDARNGKARLHTEQGLLAADDQLIHTICRLIEDSTDTRMEPDVAP